MPIAHSEVVKGWLAAKEIRCENERVLIVFEGVVRNVAHSCRKGKLCYYVSDLSKEILDQLGLLGGRLHWEGVLASGRGLLGMRGSNCTCWRCGGSRRWRIWLRCLLHELSTLCPTSLSILYRTSIFYLRCFTLRPALHPIFLLLCCFFGLLIALTCSWTHEEIINLFLPRVDGVCTRNTAP